MKVLLINGSPHEKGCPYTALSLIAGELNASGIETEILNVGTKPVGGCIGCGGCAAEGLRLRRRGQRGHRKGQDRRCLCVRHTCPLCVRLRQHDQLHGPSGLRGRQVSGLQARRHLRFGPPRRHHHHAGPAGEVPEFFHMPLVSGSYWPMVHGSKPEQVLEDAEGCAVMRELGRNMAWLLQCIELGKANGITHPRIPAAHDQFHPLNFRLRLPLPAGGFLLLTAFISETEKIRGGFFFRSQLCGSIRVRIILSTR